MSGLNRHTGRAVEGLAHLSQSIADILTTPIGTRVMRRDYGSELPFLLDQPTNGITQIAEQTEAQSASAEQVQSAIKALGYTPNFAAQVMAAKRTFTIGAIIPTMENAIFARGLQAFQEELHQHGYTLLVSSSAYKPDIEEEQIRTLAARGADGAGAKVPGRPRRRDGGGEGGGEEGDGR